MAIDITCYTTIDAGLLQVRLNIIKLRYDFVFNNAYIMHDINEVLTHQQIELLTDCVEKYRKETDLLIAEEFGLNEARSYFMISVNDKSFSEMNTSEMADLLRNELGKENIIVLLDGETLI